MKPVRARVVFGTLMVAISASMLVWGFWPVRMEQRIVPLTASDLQPPSSGVHPGKPDQQEGFTGPMELVTEWPATLRAGDSAPIRMNILPPRKIDSSRQDGVVEDQSSGVESAILSQSQVYQSVAQGKLELTGMEYQPKGVTNEALLPGQAVRFRWDVRAKESGLYPGTLWLHLRYLPRVGGAEARKVISAQTVDIQVSKFLGLAGNGARILGSIGLVLGAMVALDLITLLSDLLFPKKPGIQAGQN